MCASTGNERKTEEWDFTTELYMQLEKNLLFIQHTGHGTAGQLENSTSALSLKQAEGYRNSCS